MGDECKLSLLERICWKSPLERGGMATIYPILDGRGNKTAVAKVAEITRMPLLWQLSNFFSKKQVANLQIIMDESYKTLDIEQDIFWCLGYLESWSLRCSQTERKMLERFKHLDNVAKIKGHEFFYRCGRLYSAIEMDYLEGHSLQQYEMLGLPRKDLAKALADIAGLLLFFEKEKVIHRDIKPDNIIYSPAPEEGSGKATLIDFGFALDEKDFVRGEGPVGTPGYLSPEQAGDCSLTTKTDIFSLGITAYKCFTQKHLFEYFSEWNAVEFSSIWYYGEEERKEAVSELRRCGLPDGLAEAVGMALYHLPEKRRLEPLRDACLEIAAI